jgi:hypothetical protein
MHTRRPIHIPQNLRPSNPNPIHPRQHRILNRIKLEPGTHIRRQSLRMRPMHELERVLEPELQDDAVRGIRVRCAVPRALVEPAESGELDPASADVHLLGEHAGRAVGAELEVVDDGVVQVECGRAADTSEPTFPGFGEFTHKY